MTDKELIIISDSTASC